MDETEVGQATTPTNKAMTELPDKCPKCGAAFKEQISSEIRWECGSTRDLLNLRSSPLCYEREIARLREALEKAGREADKMKDQYYGKNDYGHRVFSADSLKHIEQFCDDIKQALATP